MKTIMEFKKAGNQSVGIYQHPRCGDFLAMTYTASRNFKTQKGAEAWLAQRGYSI